MALRGTLTHRKTRRLARSLHLDQVLALGILEGLWHVTAEQTPRGDIGKLRNRDIADEMFVESIDPDVLVNALIESEWLEISDEHRLIVHHWSEHADDATDMKLARAGMRYADGNPPRMTKLSVTERERIRALRGWGSGGVAQKGTEGHEKALPEPAPAPEPVPVPAPASVPEPKNGTLNGSAGHKGEAKAGSGLTLEKFMAAWNRHHKQNKHESTQRVFQMVLSFNVNWEELEKKHIPYCAYWSKKGWNFCPLSFLQWIENGMLGPPDEKPAETREPDWVDPYAGIAEAEEEPPPKSQPEPQRAGAQPHLITRRRAQ